MAAELSPPGLSAWCLEQKIEMVSHNLIVSYRYETEFVVNIFAK